MNKRIIILAAVLLLIVSIIYFIESNKIGRQANNNLIKTQASNKLIEKTQATESNFDYSGPELVGISGYLNTGNRTITIKQELEKGNIVLVDFWTYTCINCIRTLPYLKDWDAKYRDKGLTIIGVHTPEFDFEKDYDNVQAAVNKYEIKYAVVQDNDYETWQAFRNSYWPRKYIIDIDGKIVYDHIGEGGYSDTEKKIQELLEKNGMIINENISDEKTAQRYQLTPELYLGYGFALPRNQDIGNTEGLQPEKTIEYEMAKNLVRNVIYLKGKWKSNNDYVESKQANATLILNYTASSVNIVADNLKSDPIIVEVFIDDKYLTEEIAGDDLKFDGDKSFVRINEPRLYNIVKGEYGSHKLTLVVSEEFGLNAFTFG